LSNNHYRILGSIASPYTQKIRSIFRYRRIPHIYVQGRPEYDAIIASVKVPVVPVVRFPDGSEHNDSTPLIYKLEERHPSERSIIPDNPALAFLAYLIEDMADEWATKMMFHYRWYRPRDQQQMSKWLAFDRLSGSGVEAINEFADNFRDRQTGRMAMVGCTAENAPIIEASAQRLFAILEAHVPSQRYLFGTRPSLADFSLYGQLSQMYIDPTPRELFCETAPFAVRWLMQLDDASGIDGDWADSVLPVTEQLLEMAGDTYFPFLLANAKAVMTGETEFNVELPGGIYHQATFKYQAKCLLQLREAYAALSDASKAEIEPVLTRTGCLSALTA
jgi:glutathione S-transferase